MLKTRSQVDELTYAVVGAAIEVHKSMGRGLTENVFHECMKEELKIQNLNFVTEMVIPVHYKNKLLDISFRCDLFVEATLVVELKSATEISNVFEAQLLNYMRLLKAPKGILINFNSTNIFKEGQRTFVNEYYKLLK